MKVASCHSSKAEVQNMQVTHLFNSGIAMAVATSSTSEGYEEKTKRHKESIFGKFAHIVTGSDKELDRGKPAPGKSSRFFLNCWRQWTLQ